MSLFQGTPQNASSYSESSSSTPKWMQDAIYNQINWAQNAANKPYESYDMPTVAGLSQLQQDAYTGIENAQGVGQDELAKAQTGMEGLSTKGTAEALRTAQGDYLRQDLVGQNLDAGQTLFDTAGGLSITGAAAPNMTDARTSALNIVGAGQGYLTDAANMSASSAANPYITQGTQMSGMSAANPYLNQAQNTTAQALADKAMNAANPYFQGAAQTSVSNINEYMNPYQQNVLDTLAKQGTRNLTENLLPGVSDSFIKAGQFGSRGMGEFGSRALRDTQEAILDKQGALAAQGYAQGLQTSAADKARLGQLGQSVGSISGADLSRVLQGGSQYGQLGQTAGQLTGADAGRQLQAGQTMGQLTGADAGRQAQIGQTLSGMNRDQASTLGSLGQSMGQLTSSEQQNLANIANMRTQAGQGQQQYGLNAASTAQQAQSQDYRQQESALNNMAGLAAQEQAMTYTDLAALEAAGKAQQQQLQTELSAAEKEFMDESLYDQRQLDFLSTQVRGLAPIVPTTTTTSGTTTGATYNPSPLSQIATGLATYKGIKGT